MIKSLYIHIPFCNSICSYCGFNKRIYNEKLAEEYINNILLDLERIQPYSLKTIFIGGGTPTSLSKRLLIKLLSKLNILLDKDYEFTIETNPENILDQEKVSILARYGINRVSIGVQTFDNKLLKILGRKHTKEDVDNAINNLLFFNITNINFDLIYGLPFQTLDIFLNDINVALSYNIKHISLYSLTIDKNTIFYNEKFEEKDEDLLREMSDEATSILGGNGFHKYEVSNYCKQGYESVHNLTYWFNNEYYGVGVSASGYENRVRYTNNKSIVKYLNGNRDRDEEYIDDYNYEYEYIMLNLRTKFGINLIDYKNKFNKNFYETYENVIKELSKYLIIENDSIHISGNNYMILNTIILKFIDELEADYDGLSSIEK